MSKKYKIDLTKLHKGDYLSPATLETVLEVPRGHKRWQLELLSLKCYIESSRLDAGSPVVLKGENEGLRVLTDSEALEYVESQFEAGRRRMRTASGKQRRVETSNLTPEERKANSYYMFRQGMLLGAMDEASRRVKARPPSGDSNIKNGTANAA